MNTITITVPTEKDVELLKQIADKMGYKAQVKTEVKKDSGIDEITLMSESALAEAWLDPEDDVYNNL